jgi:hypothetical protein
MLFHGGDQVIELVGVGFGGEDGSAVIARERAGFPRFVGEVKDIGIVLLRLGAFERESASTALRSVRILSTYIVCRSGSS